MNSESQFGLVLVGFDTALHGLITGLLKPLNTHHLSDAKEVEEFLESYRLTPGTTVMVSTALKGMSQMEAGQAFNSYFQGLRLIFVTTEREQFETAALKKNGFSESYLLPADEWVLRESLEEIKQNRNVGGSRKFRAVKMLDLQAEQDLPFEVRVFMPLNNKFALLSAGGKLTAKKCEMLQKRNINSVFVDQTQLGKFYEYTAERLVALNLPGTDGLSETERSSRLQASVRTLFHAILTNDKGASGNYDEGRDLFEQSKKVVENFVRQKTGLDLNAKLREVMGEGKDAYSHAQSVSTIAALLSMATGIGKPEDLAIAGLFHDLGVGGSAQDIGVFNVGQLSPEEFAKFSQHPRESLNLLKEKKITVTPEIAAIIECHHERADGKGFPKQMPGHKIPAAAHLLAFADAFEELSRPNANRAALTLIEIQERVAKGLGTPPEILLPIYKFLGNAEVAA